MRLFDVVLKVFGFPSTRSRTGQGARSPARESDNRSDTETAHPAPGNDFGGSPEADMTSAENERFSAVTSGLEVDHLIDLSINTDSPQTAYLIVDFLLLLATDEQLAIIRIHINGVPLVGHFHARRP